MLNMEWIGLYIVLGAFAGFMAGLLGVGGGGMLVPLLASIFTAQGMNTENVVHLALGTSLTTIIVSSTASIRAHAARGAVEWRIVGRMAPGVMLGAFLTSQTAAKLDSGSISLFFALFMALVAARIFFDWQPQPCLKPMTVRELIGVGAGIGSVSALAAVGGGFLTVAYLGYKNMDMKRAIGTSAAMGLPIAIAGTVGYLIGGGSETLGEPLSLGFVHVPAFLAISIVSSVAAPLGARCSQSLPEIVLKRMFAVISLVLSIKMLLSFARF